MVGMRCINYEYGRRKMTKRWENQWWYQEQNHDTFVSTVVSSKLQQVCISLQLANMNKAMIESCTSKLLNDGDKL
jgi:phage terminase large subunit-like protein